MTETIKALGDTPIPTMLVVAGIVFLLLSVAGKLSTHLVIPESRKKQALLLGLLMLGAGVVLNLQPVGSAKETTAQATPEAKPLAMNWDDKTWEGMTPEQRGHWAVLGWTEESWKLGTEPASYSKEFGALTAAEKAAVTALGYAPDQW